MACSVVERGTIGGERKEGEKVEETGKGQQANWVQETGLSHRATSMEPPQLALYDVKRGRQIS